MGIAYSKARWVALLSLAINLSAQVYGILSTPNMKDVHDANLSFYSPHPYMVGLVFFLQQLAQVAWLYRLFKINPKESAEKKYEAQLMVDYVPYLAVGNLCIATWMIFWNASALKSANVFVLVNSFVQLYFIFFKLPPMNTCSTPSILTHLTSRIFAGIAVLDFLHNGSVAYFDHEGTTLAVEILTGFGFVGLSLVSDWILGSCLVYDLVAIAVGQRTYGAMGWSNLLIMYAFVSALIVAGKNWFRPPYVSESCEGYEPVQDVAT